MGLNMAGLFYVLFSLYLMIPLFSSDSITLTNINIFLSPRDDPTPRDVSKCNYSPDKMLSISLVPKGLKDETSDKIQCGIDETIDAERLIAEWNSELIFKIIRSKDQDLEYKTKVHNFITFDSSSQPILGKTEDVEDGVFSLFLVPPTAQCNADTLDQASNGEKGFHSIYIGAFNNVSELQEKFIEEVKCLKKDYGDEKPILCFTQLPMNNRAAHSRIEALQAIFNFPYNSGRTINLNKFKQCKSEEETEKAIAISNMFDVNPNCEFQATHQTVLESVGFAKAMILRNTTIKKAIISVETSFMTGDGAAEENDVVNLNYIAVFDKDKNSTEVFVMIKSDNVKEEEEKFNLTLHPFLESKRTKRDVLKKLDDSQKTQLEIKIDDLECSLEPADQNQPNQLPFCGKIFWINIPGPPHLKEYEGPWKIEGEINPANNEKNKWKNGNNILLHRLGTWVISTEINSNVSPAEFMKVSHAEMVKEGDGIWSHKKKKKTGGWIKNSKTKKFTTINGVCETDEDCAGIAQKPQCDKRPEKELGVCRPANDFCKVDTDCKLAARPTCNTETFTCVECSENPDKDYTHISDPDCAGYPCKCDKKELKRTLILECESFWYENKGNAMDGAGNFYQAGPELKIMINNKVEGHFHLATATPEPTIVSVNCPYNPISPPSKDDAQISQFNYLVKKCKKAVNEGGFTFYEQNAPYDQYQKGKPQFEIGRWRKTSDFKNNPGFFLNKRDSNLGGNGPKSWACKKKKIEYLLPNNDADIETLLGLIFPN